MSGGLLLLKREGIRLQSGEMRGGDVHEGQQVREEVTARQEDEPDQENGTRAGNEVDSGHLCLLLDLLEVLCRTLFAFEKC